MQFVEFRKVMEVIKKDVIWETYLNAFPTEETRQEHICNCCKSFIR